MYRSWLEVVIAAVFIVQLLARPLSAGDVLNHWDDHGIPDLPIDEIECRPYSFVLEFCFIGALRPGVVAPKVLPFVVTNECRNTRCPPHLACTSSSSSSSI